MSVIYLHLHDNAHCTAPPQHTPTTQHTNPKEQDRQFSCFHISTTVQAQCVHNIAASCSTVTATYRCNQHTNFQTPQPHKQFTIQTVTTHSLHFPCTYSNQLLSLQSLYTADLSTSQQHTSLNVSSTFPILSAPLYCIFSHCSLYVLLHVNVMP